MAGLKTLRVCLSSELPPEVDREDNYIYFTYDTLSLYLGQNEFCDNFAIADTYPEEPVNSMIYLLSSDGSVHKCIDYIDTTLAEIEDPSQIDLLKAAGTVIGVNANRRFFDKQQRTITLPFNNGLYELSVSAREDQVYNNDTILKYNEDTERFEIYGPSSEEFVDYSKPFRGGETSTVKITVDKSRLKGEVKLSKIPDNALRATSDGLFVKLNDKLDKKTFDEFYEDYIQFKNNTDSVLSNLSLEIEALENLISDETINRKIYSILSEKFDNIRAYLDAYNDLYNRMNQLETELISYADLRIEAARQDILSKIQWVELQNRYTENSDGINYYNKAKEYFTRGTNTSNENQGNNGLQSSNNRGFSLSASITDDNSLTETQKKILISAALEAFINDNN